MCYRKIFFRGSMLFFFILCPYTLTLSQVSKNPEQQKYLTAPSIGATDDVPVVINHPPMRLPNLKSSSITWTIIDTGRFYSSIYHNIRPLAYEPKLGILTHIHQRRLPSMIDVIRGTFYSGSSDNGITWTRYPTDYNDVALDYPDPLGGRGAWPSCAMFNPNNNISNSYFFGGYPTCNYDGVYQDAVLAIDHPIMGDSRSFEHAQANEVDSIYYIMEPHTAQISSGIYMLDLYTTGNNPDYNIATKHRLSLARSNGSGNIIRWTPAPWDSQAWKNAAIWCGGDYIVVGGTGITAAGMYGEYYSRQIWNDTVITRVLAWTKSTDNGLTWSDFDTCNLNQVAGIGLYRTFWHYIGSYINAINHSFVLDANGDPHFFFVLQKEPFGDPPSELVVAEIYKESGTWKGKIVAPVNKNAKRTVKDIDQFGIMLQAGRNGDGKALFVKYNNGTNNHCDIYVSGRLITALNWKSPVNITNSPNAEEVVSHMAQYVRHDGGNLYTTFHSWDYVDENLPDINIPDAVYYCGSYQLDVTPVNFNCNCFSGSCSSLAGRTVTRDTVFDHFSMTLCGDPTQTDSFWVRFRIIKSDTILYAESLKIALSPYEIREVVFPGTFRPSSLGTYDAECGIFLLNGTGDVLIGSFIVIEPSPIAQTVAFKKYKPYDEITGTPTGVFGDDSTGKLGIPFNFVFDGISYDSIRFSTNGWVEFGRSGSTDFTLKLHRTESRLTGGIPNNYLGREFSHSNSDVNKVFAAWWDDMTTQANNPGAEDSGDISYATLGSEPNRVFVLQYKNMGAYYAPNNRGTRINFQIRLYETTNVMEFCYGPKSDGYFSPEVLADGEFGASIGIKDTIGGSYHFFDVWKYLYLGRGYGEQSDLEYYERSFLKTDLRPINDWPGPDTVYYFRTGPVNETVTLNRRWNLISNPLLETKRVTEIFSNAIPGTTFAYDSGHYVQTDSLVPGWGYWTKFSLTPEPIVITGPRSLIVTRTLSPGWRLIGGPDREIPAPSGGIVRGPTFGYSGWYQAATTLKPGKGYWIKTTGGVLVLGPGAAPKQQPLDEYSIIDITANAQEGQRLYLAPTKEGFNADDYDPPLTPGFDARFAGNQLRAVYSQESKSDEKFPISLQNVVYPLTLSWNIRNSEAKGFALEVLNNGEVSGKYPLNGKNKITLNKGVTSFVLTVTNGSAIPKEFVLAQNYPNPFNPVTTIRYELPQESFVMLKLYNLLGQTVVVLINEKKEAGRYEVNWDAGNLPSGVYFYKIQAGSFISVKKMLLLK